uniref:Uncharacterized protein n=1 Tax=Meloidogyne enterolobii TaxID=390850 RepID=A0A6V7UCH8_MELEN|nr:unnamed protein product [Meloidogyne enterolobii]
MRIVNIYDYEKYGGPIISTCPSCRRGILHDPEPLQENGQNEHNGTRNQNLSEQTENNNQLSLINLV